MGPHVFGLYFGNVKMTILGTFEAHGALVKYFSTSKLFLCHIFGQSWSEFTTPVPGKGIYDETEPDFALYTP